MVIPQVQTEKYTIVSQDIQDQEDQKRYRKDLSQTFISVIVRQTKSKFVRNQNSEGNPNRCMIQLL
jgi:hypothetical protein